MCCRLYLHTVSVKKNVFFTADEILPVGSIRVNSLNDLCLTPALKDLLDFSLTRTHSGPRPLLNTKSKVFEIDSCRTIGKVLLHIFNLDFSIINCESQLDLAIYIYGYNITVYLISFILQICLVYTGGMWSVWLATREGVWGWLADSFTHYFRMCLVHLGLPGWQATFANLPLIPWAEVSD